MLALPVPFSAPNPPAATAFTQDRAPTRPITAFHPEEDRDETLTGPIACERGSSPASKVSPRPSAVSEAREPSHRTPSLPETTTSFVRDEQADPVDPWDGLTVAGYELLGEVGRGGMGVIYRARQTEQGQVVALKVPRGGSRAGRRKQEYLRTEARVLARLRHPNILRLHSAGEWQGCPYLVLEFAAGGSLARWTSRKALPSMLAARLVELMARAVHHLHMRGLVHCDLKPSNVLLVPGTGAHGVWLDGGPAGPGPYQPRIADFGLARGPADAGADAALARRCAGTPGYMAPEQAGERHGEIGPAADVYALGATLHCLLTGRPPFRGMPFCNHPEVAEVPPELEAICRQCLENEPSRRYAKAGNLADHLARFLAASRGQG